MAMLNITDITIDDRCQPREALDHRTVAEYADDMREGATFAPVTVFTDGTSHWLADGFHRVAAARLASLDTIAAEVKAGTLRDAILYAAGANGTHGLRRTNADKRRAVSRLLDDAEWSAWSDREIARQCGVTHPFVARVRSERSGNGYHIEGHRRLVEIRILEAESRLHTLIRDVNRGGREWVETLDAVKAKLAPDQYRAWTEQALGLGEEAEARLRQSVSDANPDAYLGFWLDQMLETVPAD
jgi:hypothetical protein